MNNKAIGVFDSGVGGLSCIPAISKALPNEQIIYFGDTARAPYGSRPVSEIISFSLDIAARLIDMGCKSLSIACNTISCVAIDEIRAAFPGVPVVGIVEPAAEKIASEHFEKRLGLIATEATVRSGAYPNAIAKYRSGISVKAKDVPAFVPVIEAGRTENAETDALIKEELDDFVKDIDALILGCTHYPFLKNNFQRLYPRIELIDPAQFLAEKTAEQLRELSLLAEVRPGENKFISSSKSDTFDNVVRRIICTI